MSNMSSRWSPPASFRYSPITARVHANYVLDDTELSWVKQSLELDQQRLTQVNNLLDEIPATSLELECLGQQQEELSLSLRHHITLLCASPIRRVPNEVLASIFVAYRDISQSEALARPRHPNSIVRRIMDIPYLPSHICRRWRLTALSEPRLWTTIPILFPRFSASSPVSSPNPNRGFVSEGFMATLRTRIALAQRLPVTMVFTDHGYRQGHPVHADIFQMFVDLFPRCQSISFYLRARFDAHSMWGRSCFIQPSSTLKDLHLTLFPHSLSSQIDVGACWLNRMMGLAPNLSTLDVLNCHPKSLWIGVTTTTFPDRLVHLRAERTTCLFENLRDFLHRHPHLQTLAVGRLEINGDVGSGGPPVTHEALSRLHIGSVNPHQLKSILGCMTLPALTSFSTEQTLSAHALQFWPTKDVLQFLARSGCKLQELALRNFPGNDDIVQVLRAQPSLRKLGLTFAFQAVTEGRERRRTSVGIPGVSKGTLTALFDEGNASVCARLAEVALALVPSQVPTVLRLLDARNDGVQARLRRVGLSVHVTELNARDSDWKASAAQLKQFARDAESMVDFRYDYNDL